MFFTEKVERSKYSLEPFPSGEIPLKKKKKTEDRYGQLVCYGIAAIIFFHTLVNIGMVIGVMPVKGLPLLLLSYGGSSLMFVSTMLGIVQSVKTYGSK